MIDGLVKSFGRSFHGQCEAWRKETSHTGWKWMLTNHREQQATERNGEKGNS